MIGRIGLLMWGSQYQSDERGHQQVCEYSWGPQSTGRIFPCVPVNIWLLIKRRYHGVIVV